MTTQPIRCPHCNKMFLAPAGSDGQIVACPHCQGQLRMPAAAQTAAITPPPATPPPRPPAPMATPATAVPRPAAAPPSPPPVPPAAPQIGGGAPAAPALLINDPSQTSATGRLIHRRKSNNNLVLFIAIPIALLFVVGAIGIIALVANRKSGDREAEEITEELFREFELVVSALESVKDEASAEQAARRIKLSVQRIEELVERADKVKVSKSKDKELELRVRAQFKELLPRMESAVETALQNSDENQALVDALMKVAQLQKLAG